MAVRFWKPLPGTSCVMLVISSSMLRTRCVQKDGQWNLNSSSHLACNNRSESSLQSKLNDKDERYRDNDEQVRFRRCHTSVDTQSQRISQTVLCQNCLLEAYVIYGADTRWQDSLDGTRCSWVQPSIYDCVLERERSEVCSAKPLRYW